MELLPSFIKAPRSARYLNDFMPDGLPTNCLFDKVTTGCGGTYVALMCNKPYIVAVPTKALVKDTLTKLGIPKAKAVFIKRWFEVKEVQVFKERGYRIICKL